MAKDPTKINPVSTPVKTYPGERADKFALPTVPELLPTIFRTETNKKLIAAVMEDMFQPHAMEDLNYSVGRRTTKPLINDYLPHPTAKRQLEPGLVVYRADNSPATLSADEIAQGWGLNDRTQENTVPVSILDLPIDPDKFINWVDYYWITEGMPVIFLSGGVEETFSVQNDILGKPSYTSVLQKNGKQLPFFNGMRIVFQNLPGRLPIDADFNFEAVTDGNSYLDLDYDFVAYDKSKIIVTVDGIVQTFKTDYTIFGNTVQWINVPAAGLSLSFNCVEYFLTTDNDSKVATRRWQIDGVGDNSGIRLLTRTHQYTNTRYSKATQTLWDKTAVPWDSVEWDGAIKGINEKHYILEKVGAQTANTNSRTNVWYHKEAVQATADYLDIKFNEIVTSTGTNTTAMPAQALRPIVEFEDTLELFNHGTTFRAWPNLLISVEGITASDFVNLPITDTDLVNLNLKYIQTIKKLKTIPDIIVRVISHGNNIQTALNRTSFTEQEFTELLNTPSRKILYEVSNGKINWLKNPPANWSITYRIGGVPVNKLRMLWLVNDESKNKIINVTVNQTQTSGYVTETARDGDAVLIDTPYDTDPNYLLEYHWVNGEAIKAQTRLSRIQQPTFELYDSDNNRLSDNPNKPQIKNSAIIEIVKGDKYDPESGYNLQFLPSQFSELTETNTAADAMYDIVYNHTLQNFSYYNQGVGTRTVKGPYQFRRVTGTAFTNELSTGYTRAWFRLKSWAIRNISKTNSDLVDLDTTMWPSYNWGIKLVNDELKVIYLDNFEIVAKNIPRLAIGEPAQFTVFSDHNPTEATISGVNFETFTVDIINNRFGFVVPNNVPARLTITIEGQSFQAKIIDVKQDPRNVKVKLNGLPTDYDFVIERNDNNTVKSVQLNVNGTGTLEIQHQGKNIDGDHITAIPGLSFNPEQNINLGHLTPSRLVHAMKLNIDANKQHAGQSWLEVDYINDANGAVMADNSSMRSAWSSFRLAPSIQDSVIARSMSSWRWWRKFINKLESNFNLLDFNLNTPSENLNRIIEEMLLGVSYSSPDAISGMALSTNAMNYASYIGDSSSLVFDVNTGSNGNIYTDFYGPDIVYVYIEGELIAKENYVINTVFPSITFNDAPQTGAKIEIYHSAQAGSYCGIPASPAKLGLSGLYKPGFVTETWGSNTRNFIQRHDGSRIATYGVENDLRDLVILELENRIYNGCIHSVGAVNQQRQFRAYRRRPILEAQAKAQVEWYTTNNIDYQDRSDFNAEDPWTWNYNGKSWRAIYINSFDTYQLDVAPWESLGYDIAPTWWNDYYSWTDSTKRTALEHALRYGIVSEPGAPVSTVPAYCRKFNSFPVDEAGNLVDPTAWVIPAPSADDAQQPWEIGSWSPVEMAWRRSIAGSWDNVLHAIEDYAVVHSFIDCSINPFINDIDTNSPMQKGYSTFAPSQFFQDRPTIGIGAILFEAYREFNLSGQAPLNELMSLDSRLQFGMGGFSDGVISLKMYYAKFKNGFYIPAEDFLMTLSPGVATSVLRYSAVRVEKDGDGFRLYGFDPGHKYFTIFRPTTRSLSGSFPIGRTQVTTPNGTFVSYSDWDNIAHKIQYGTYINDKQELFTFFEGLQAYQQSQGLILDQVNDRGTITNWQQAALDALSWIAENWGTNHFCLVSVATNDGLKFQHERGLLDILDADLGRTGKVLFSNGRSALPSELLITRDYEKNVDKIAPLGNQQIVFINFAVRDYDHIVYLNRKTKFGDLLIDLQTGNRIDVLAMAARRTNGWTGRPTARGVTLTQAGLIPGFDALISDVLDAHKPEQNAFDSIKSEIAKSDIVPAKATIIDQLIQAKDTQHFYKQGLQTAMGTNLAINALLRNEKIDIPGRQQDIDLNEQWLLSAGEFGNLESQSIWEIELRKEDFTANRQVVRFAPRGYNYIIKDTGNGRPEILYDSKSDNIIDIWEKDKRWVSKPLNLYDFATIDRSTQTGLEATKNWAPSAGVAQLFDTDIKMRDLSGLQLSNFINVDQTNNPVSQNVVIDRNNLLTTSNIFSTNGFGIYNSYQPGDLCWQQGKLYRAKEKITGSATSAFDLTQWELQPIDGRLLPNVWVSDYGFNISTKFKGGWLPNKSYKIGDIIDYDGFYNICIKDHASGNTFVNNQISNVVIEQKGLNYQVGDLVKSGTVTVGNVSSVINGTIKTVNVVDNVGGYNPATTTITVAGGSGTALLSASYKNDSIEQTITGSLERINLPAGVTGLGNNYFADNTEVVINGEGTGATATVVLSDNIQQPLYKYGVISTFEIKVAGTGYAVGEVITIVNPIASAENAIASVVSINSTGGITGLSLLTNQATGSKGGQSYTNNQECETTAKKSDGSASIGSGAIVKVLTTRTVDTGITRPRNGVITGFTITSPGKDYKSGTTSVSIRRKQPRTSVVITGFQITAINVLTEGQGDITYPSDIKVLITGGGATRNATATPNIVNGKLTSITVTDGGAGYNSAIAPTVTIVDPFWADADSSALTFSFAQPSTITVNRYNLIDKIYVLDGGSNYTTASAITITDPTRASALAKATATITETNNGAVSAIAITNSTSTFDQLPSLSIQSTNGSGASVSATVASYWRLKTTGYSWNILQTFSPMYVEETCPNALNTALNESKVTFANPHGLRINDYIVMVGNNDGSYDKVHKVKEIVDDFNILIAARSTSGQIVYNTVAFKLSPVKFETVPEYEQSKNTLPWLKGMKAYIDHDGQDTVAFDNRFTVIEYGNNSDGTDHVILSEARMVDPFAIHKVQLLDEKSANVLGVLEVYDPFKGANINEVVQYLNYQQTVDPAVYNVDELGVLNKFVTMAWGKRNIGKTWWDTSRVRYIEYEQGTLNYRATNWGKQFVDSEVVVYEWVSSIEEPTIDTPGMRFDNSSGVDQLRYSQIDEMQTNGGVITTYYYWKRNVSELPTSVNRPYSSASMENVLNNPDANGVAWMSPLQVTYDANGPTSASIMVANIAGFFAGRDKVILRIEQNKKPEQKHNTGMLLTEGMSGSIIPDYPVTRLRDSLVGYDNYRMLHAVKQFVVGGSYAVGDLITTADLENTEFTYTSAYGGRDVPILPIINANREDVEVVWQDDDTDSFGIFRVVAAINNATTWANALDNVIKFQTGLVKNVLEENKYYAVVISSRQVPDIRLHPLRRYGNQYTPLPQSWFKELEEARRTFVDVINDSLRKVDTVDKFNWDKYLRIWQPLFGSKALDVTQYWYYVNYAVDNYAPGNEEIKIRSFTELLNYTNPTKFALVDTNNVIQSVYRVDDLANNKFTLLYKRNGTIQFYPIWRTSGWDVKEWDGYPWDEGFTDIFAIILKALRENIFVGSDAGYFNRVFFTMVKEALVQDPLADWVFKTTYLAFDSNSSNDLEQVPIFYDKKDALLKKYVNEVKPYHSEMLDRGTFDKSLQQLPVSLDEDMELTVIEKNIIGVEPGYIRMIDRRRNGTPEPVTTYDKLSTEDLRPLLINITTITQVVVEED